MRSELGNKMCMLTRFIQVRKDIKCISEPTTCPTLKSANSLVRVCNFVYDLLTPSLITKVLRYHIFPKSIALKGLSQSFMERY